MFNVNNFVCAYINKLVQLLKNIIELNDLEKENNNT